MENDPYRSLMAENLEKLALNLEESKAIGSCAMNAIISPAIIDDLKKCIPEGCCNILNSLIDDGFDPRERVVLPRFNIKFLYSQTVVDPNRAFLIQPIGISGLAKIVPNPASTNAANWLIEAGITPSLLYKTATYGMTGLTTFNGVDETFANRLWFITGIPDPSTQALYLVPASLWFLWRFFPPCVLEGWYPQVQVLAGPFRGVYNITTIVPQLCTWSLSYSGYISVPWYMETRLVGNSPCKPC